MKVRGKGHNVADGAPTPTGPALRADAGGFDDLWNPPDSSRGPSGPERILLERGDITSEQLEAAQAKKQENPRQSVLEALAAMKVIDDLQALSAIAAYFNLPLIRLKTSDIQPEAFSLLPVEYLKHKSAIPIARNDDGLLVGISDPSDIFLIDDLKRRLGANLQLAVVPAADTSRVIEEMTAAPDQQVDDIIKDIAEDAVEVVDEKAEEVTDLERIAGESPVIRYVNFLITSAVREGASDIHIEPGESKLRVRFRIDGVLFDQQSPPISMHAAVVSRLKIMANMDISERRLPQDGRIRATVRGRNVDLRVSTLPVTHGEKCVIRILDNRSILVGLENLGMLSDCLSAFNRQVTQPHGIILVTGPTGSGKSTTLYSALRVMDGSTMNISTVEDPVEYELDFANQVGVHENIGMTFSAALRSLLRQDPDVIMIGEIRDDETARIAVQASLTGHLVLSTLHTNDAPSSITRLINIGVEPYLISASLNAVLAQRLVRKICDKCKQKKSQLSETELAYLKSCGHQGSSLYQGAGCDVCRHTGYKGRLGIYELLELDDELRDAISSSPSVTELRHLARSKGMRTLRDDGVQKALAGQTTLEEVMRATET
ncbi:MAG: Flp pilus assembly complex ATPase component TadA [Planctomycetes bacterium]|nr:Flp pilus assembly complex ATPase component TadA [Planctomycetota bacterium]